MSEEKKGIAVASDHAGVECRKAICSYLKDQGYSVVEFGPDSSSEKVDYPDEAFKVAEMVARGEVEKGVLICGTGIGMSIAANKVPGVRAALVFNEFTALYAGKHNNANVITLPGRILSPLYCVELLKVWLNADFEGGRHQRRLDKIEEAEKKYTGSK